MLKANFIPKNELFNNMFYISPISYDTRYFTPSKKKIENEDTMSCSNTKSQYTMSQMSTEKKKGESCLMTELVKLLDECSPLKSNEKNNKENEYNNFVNEKNYLIEGYLMQEEKQQCNRLNPIAKKLNFNPMIEEEEKNEFNFYKNKKHSKCNKNFKEREGDWECSKCKNLNYCFRKKCNRCHCDKKESQQQYSIISHNLLSILKGIN